MKRHIRASGLTALTLSALTTMNCTTEKVDAAYIGPSQIEIQDGKMTPEVLFLKIVRESYGYIAGTGRCIRLRRWRDQRVTGTGEADAE